MLSSYDNNFFIIHSMKLFNIIHNWESNLKSNIFERTFNFLIKWLFFVKFISAVQRSEYSFTLDIKKFIAVIFG